MTVCAANGGKISACAAFQKCADIPLCSGGVGLLHGDDRPAPYMEGDEVVRGIEHH